MGPVVLFPEGATSNGFSTLKFQESLFDALASIKPRIHVLALRYDHRYDINVL
jgi:hypothetical protein